MKTQDKEILLKDLCAMLPYKPQVVYNGVTKTLSTLHIFDMTHLKEECVDIKPYLRPMSSLTEKEVDELKMICDDYDLCDECGDIVSTIYGMTVLYGEVEDVYPYNLKIKISPKLNYAVLDYLNAHHFDYRGLIPMGLALPAPEGMYDFK